MQNKMRDPARVSDHIFNGDGAPLGDSEKRKPFYSRRLDDRFQIANERVERNIVHVPIRQAVSSRVIADEPVIPGEAAEHKQRAAQVQVRRRSGLE